MTKGERSANIIKRLERWPKSPAQGEQHKGRREAVKAVESEKTLEKTLKKVLTKGTGCARINKLSEGQRWTLKIEQHEAYRILLRI